MVDLSTCLPSQSEGPRQVGRLITSLTIAMPVAGFAGGVHSVARYVAWILIFWELVAHLVISGAVAAAVSALPDASRRGGAWARARAVADSVASPRIFLKLLPAVGPSLKLSDHPRTEAKLREHSIVYRVLYFVLQ